MLAATHTAHAPWTLVDFNDQRRGRLTLIQDLLDRLPDTRVDAPLPAFPPLRVATGSECYAEVQPLTPIPTRTLERLQADADA